MFKEEITFNDKILTEVEIFPRSYVSGSQLIGLEYSDEDDDTQVKIAFIEDGYSIVILTIDHGEVILNDIGVFVGVKNWTLYDVYRKIILEYYDFTSLTEWRPIYD